MVFISGTGVRIPILGYLVALLILVMAVAPAGARPIIEWDFRDKGTPLWQAGGDIIDLRRTSDGLVVQVSGPTAMLTLSGLAIPTAEVGFVRLRLRVPRKINEAYFAWATVRPGRLDSHRSPRFVVPRELHGGVARTIWIPVGQLPGWLGTVGNLGAIFVTDGRAQSIVVESIAVLPGGFSTQWLLHWDRLLLDEVVDNLLLPLWSLNSVQPVTLMVGTLSSVTAGLVCVGFVAMMLANFNIMGPRLSRRFGRAALGFMIGILAGLVVLDAYFEIRTFQVERRVFGVGGPSDDYRIIDRFDLVGIAEDLKRQFAAGTQITACFGESPTSPKVWRIRYELFPLRVVKDASDVFVESDEIGTTCHPADSRLVTEADGYRVYQRR